MSTEEKPTESYNSHLAHSVKNFFPPSWLEILIYLVSSGILLSLLNYKVFTNSLGQSSGVSQDTLNSYLHSNVANSVDFFGKLFQGRSGSLVFWAFIGSIIYMAVWVVQNLFINIENDVHASEFVGLKDHEDKRHAYWNSVLSSKVFFVSSLLAIITYAIGLFNFLFPVTSRVYGLAISKFEPVKSIVSILLAIVAAAFLVYILVFGLRILARAWQWIIGNF